MRDVEERKQRKSGLKSQLMNHEHASNCITVDPLSSYSRLSLFNSPIIHCISLVTVQITAQNINFDNVARERYLTIGF